MRPWWVSSWLSLVLAISITPSAIAQQAGHYGYGQPASEEEIAGWDIDIRPDGKGLPAGSGSVEDGEMLYETACAACHGSFGEGVGRYPVLAGGQGSLAESRPEKTVGSFWPYASTLWDYIHRAMPFAAPQSLSDADVYAITAYVLYLNDLVDDEFVLTRESLSEVVMPNQGGFFEDDRPDTDNPRCMKNCKDPDSVKITSEPTLTTADPETGQAVSSTDEAEQPQAHPGLAGYQKGCELCHAAGLAGAPVTGDSAAWNERLMQGRDALIKSAMEGKGTMPAKGGQMSMSLEEITATVDYMLQQVTEND